MLFIVISILVFVLRKFLFPEYSDFALVENMQELLSAIGMMSIVYLLVLYFLCSFFYIPILIPLNIACGALYGPVLGSLVALSGVLLSCIASTISVRYVFRGMGDFAMRHQQVKKFLNQITRYGTIVVLLVRLAFVVPYLLQNIILAMTNIKLHRLLLLTLLGALPGVISYSFLGAGMVSLDDAETYGIYLLVPLVLLMLVSTFIHFTHKKLGIGRKED